MDYNHTTFSPDSTDQEYENLPLNIPGLIAVLIFYAVIFAVGVYASWKSKSWGRQTTEDVMLAGRNVGLVVGFFTMTATWVGGAFINGTAELVYNPNFGLVWCQAPFGYSISLLIGGLCFARPMREAGYTTMLDPFQQRYGKVMAGLIFIPALMGEVFWSGAVLSALGSTLSVILGLEVTTSILVSAAIAIVYTVVGGLYSVAYTDVIQLICIFVGLWLGVTFSLMNSAVGPVFASANDPVTGWIGSLELNANLGLYIDSAFLLMLGGVPWQVYFQRVLSTTTALRAQYLSVLAAFGCIFMAVPCVFMGAIAHSTNWTETEYSRYGPVPFAEENYKLVLPMVLRYLCPMPVMLIGLGAVSAAVMSSADSSILSASSMFANNLYGPFREALTTKPISDSEILWVMRLAILTTGSLATVIALTVQSIYGLWYLCSDLCYVVLFPQLCCVLFFERVNQVGALTGFIVGFLLRLTGGESLIGLPALIKYPAYDYEADVQLFPFKTMSMLISLFVIIATSIVYNSFCPKKSGDKSHISYSSPADDHLSDYMDTVHVPARRTLPTAAKRQQLEVRVGEDIILNTYGSEND